MLLDWLQRHSIHVQSRQAVSQAVHSIAHQHPFHPIRDYFSSLAWDGQYRLDSWLTTYLGAYSSMYSRAVGRLFLVAAITRTFEPGTKYDYCVILEGPQGTRKSTALRVLADPWFAESNYSLGSLNSVLSLRGVLIMELPELSALEKVEVSTIKQSLSCQIDRVRPPYGRHVIDIPRESVFAGTSNHDTYLHDETGNRRFLPIRTGDVSRIDTDALARDRDQLWAEAVVWYRARRIKCYLEGQTLAQQAEREQRARYQSDPWESAIEAWLKTGSPGGYTQVSVEQILTACLQLAVKDQKKTAQMQVAKCLRALGWERYKSTGGGRKWVWRLREGSEALVSGLVSGRDPDPDSDSDSDSGSDSGNVVAIDALTPNGGHGHGGRGKLGGRVGVSPDLQDYEPAD
jgi:predicted P-loop ATPase